MSRRATLVFIFILLFTSLPRPLTAAQEVELPTEYVGTWEGTGFQTDADGNPDGEWTITLTLTGGPVGAVAGTVNYPSLGCSGELTYLGPDHPTHGQGILLSEDITTGEGLCVDGGTFLLSSGSNSGLYFSWESPDNQTTATGDLPQVGAAAPDETGSGHVMIWTMTCPETNSTETGISVTAQLINVDPGPTCYGVESPLTFTITDAAGNATSYTTAPPDSLEFDLPFGTYTITETSSGATETFELTAREDDPEYCLDYAGCALIIVGVSEGVQAQAEGDAEVHFTGTGCDLASIPNDLRHEAPGFNAVSEADGDCYNFVLSGFGYAWPLTALDVIQPDGDFAFDDPQGFLTYPDSGGSGDIPPEFGFVLFFANATSYPTGSWQLYVLDLDGNSVSYTFEYPGLDQQPADEAILPIEFGGNWVGTAQQYENTEQGAPEETYPVELSLTAGAVSPVVGTISYPALGCSGELTWLDMTSDSITLDESITYDDATDGDSCVDGGGMILSIVDDQTLEWTWFWPDGTQGAEATLTKIGSNQGTQPTLVPPPAPICTQIGEVITHERSPDTEIYRAFVAAYDAAPVPLGPPATGGNGCLHQWDGHWVQDFDSPQFGPVVLIHQPLDGRVYLLFGEWLRSFSRGGPDEFGAPTGNMAGLAGGNVQNFDGGRVGRMSLLKKDSLLYAWPVYGAIREEYERLTREQGALGWPLSFPYDWKGSTRVTFENGYILYGTNSAEVLLYAAESAPNAPPNCINSIQVSRGSFQVPQSDDRLAPLDTSIRFEVDYCRVNDFTHQIISVRQWLELEPQVKNYYWLWVSFGRSIGQEVSGLNAPMEIDCRPMEYGDVELWTPRGEWIISITDRFDTFESRVNNEKSCDTGYGEDYPGSTLLRP